MTARTPVVVGGVVGWALALAPGQLPHPALLTAAVGTVLMLVGMGVGGCCALVAGRRRPITRRMLLCSAAVSVLLVVASHRWQVRVADGIGVAAPGPEWIAASAGIPLAVAAAVAVVPGRVWAVGAVVAALIGAPAARAHAAEPDVPADPAITYSRLDRSSDVDARARDLVARWARKPATSAVVVIVPTGSGWVDASAVTGFEERFHGDVAFVAMQYSAVPSWQAYLTSPDAATDSAIAVVRALDQRLRTLPTRPDVYVFGQSLGAIGADAARGWADRAGVRLTGTVLSGPPAGTVEPRPDCARRTVLANATDPVVDADASLLWRPPTRDVTTIGAPRAAAPWIPGVSFVGTALDLAVSLDGPVGTGHHYGVEQGLAAAPCQAIGPRAAS